MIEIKITSDTPLEALSTLVAFGTHCMSNDTVVNAATQIHEAEKDLHPPRAATQPVNPTPTPAPQAAPSTVPSAPAPMANSTTPVTEPPRFSIDDIARAGAELAQQSPDKINALNGLLQQFGLEAVSHLRQDQMGPFAVALRGLGARI